jgi:hypothetical protein
MAVFGYFGNFAYLCAAISVAAVKSTKAESNV